LYHFSCQQSRNLHRRKFQWSLLSKYSANTYRGPCCMPSNLVSSNPDILSIGRSNENGVNRFRVDVPECVHCSTTGTYMIIYDYKNDIWSQPWHFVWYRIRQTLQFSKKPFPSAFLNFSSVKSAIRQKRVNRYCTTRFRVVPI